MSSNAQLALTIAFRICNRFGRFKKKSKPMKAGLNLALIMVEDIGDLLGARVHEHW